MVKLKYKTYVPVAKPGEFIPLKRCNITLMKADLSPVGFVEGAKNVEQGGFSGSGRTDNTYNFPCIDRYIHSFQYFNRAVFLVYVLCCEHGQSIRSNILKQCGTAKPGPRFLDNIWKIA